MVRSEYYPFKSPDSRERYLAFYDARAERWPVPSETRFVHTDQGETFVRISGPEGAPPLVLLNGIYAASVMSPPAMVTAFAEKYRLYTVDNVWEFGRSVSAEDTSNRDDCVAWVGGVLDGLGLDRTYLMGISLGAWFATEYALVHPERVTKMVWMSPNGIVGYKFTPAILRSMPQGMRAMRSPTVRNVGDMLGEIMPDGAESQGEAQREYDAFVESVALGLQCYAPRPMRLSSNRRLSDAELGGLAMPVLYLAGEKETFSSTPKNLRRLARVAPRISTIVIQGCGHDLISLKPGLAAQHIIDFLDDGDGDRAIG